MVTKVLSVFIRAVFGDLRRRAADYGIEQAQCGAVTFIQRFGSALNTTVHFHAAVLDGVYAPKDNGTREFFPLRAPKTFAPADVNAPPFGLGTYRTGG